MKKISLLLYTFFLSFSLQAQDVIPADRAALIALYTATDGANWTDNTNWGTAELVSTWFGVTVVGDRVTEINLSNNGLSGGIPAEIGNLSSLTHLYLSNNQLSGTIPLQIGNLSVLQYLWLDGCQLSGLVPVEIGNLTALRTLFLNNNQLSGSIPVETGNLGLLNFFNVAGNQLSGAIPAEIGNLTNLDILNLGFNQLSGPIPVEIGNLIDLTFLSLANNNLSGAIPTETGNLTSLTSLFLGDNQLTGSIPIEIGNLTALGNLSLSNNQLSGSIPTEIGNLSSLIILNLSNNQLSGAIPTEIGSISSLTRLYLSYNQLSGSIPIEIGNLTILNELYLSNNQLNGTILTEIGNLANLMELNLSNNQLNGTIPVEIGNLISLTYLSLGDNQLTGNLPDLSTLINLTTLYIYNNYFTFEATEAAIQYSIPVYNYHPQLDFPLNKTTISASSGSDIGIDIAKLSMYNLGGSNNRYQWFKDGVPITSVSSSPVLSLTAVDLGDYGIYTCQVTNTVATDLTLISEEFELIDNAAPIVANPVADKIENEGFGNITIDLNEVFSDADGDDFSFTATSTNENIATVNTSSTILTITEVGAGNTTILVTATDGYENAKDTFGFTVNRIPTVTNPITDQLENEGFGSFTVDLSDVFSDSDGDALSYSGASDNTSVAAISVNGNVLTITESGAGTTNITITADDGLGGTIDEVFSFTINSIPRVSNPIADKTENEGFGSFTVDLSDVFTDNDGDALSYSGASDNTSVATISVNESVLTVTEAGTGMATVTATANDGRGGTKDEEFIVTINTSTSIEKLAAYGIKIYPNPSKGVFEIENNNLDQNLLLKILDIAGKTVLQRNLRQSKTYIDLTKNGKGLYFVLFKRADKIITSKLIVE